MFNPLLPVARTGVFWYAQVAHRAWRLCVPARCAHTGRRSLNLDPVHAGRWSLLRLGGCRRPVDPRRAGLVLTNSILLSLQAGGPPSCGACVVFFPLPARRGEGHSPRGADPRLMGVLGMMPAAPTGEEGEVVMDASRSGPQRR